MDQFLSTWNAFDLRKKVTIGGATVIVFLAMIGLARMAAAPNMTLLYGGLEPGAAGEIVSALEARGVTHEIRGGAIYVDSTERDGLRMTLASEGLPENSSQGYELLDGLSGFGTTSQMFDAAYWRAKEGELSRTINSSPNIRSARVHIATPAAQGLRLAAPPTASVTVSTSDGTLSPAHAKALKYLVASAVPSLSPDAVSIIDARGGLIQSVDELGASMETGSRADDLKARVQRLLEARVGHGNAVVEVDIQTANEEELIREKTFDPEGRVAISTDTTESESAASEAGSSGVTVASNLPEGDGSGTGSNSNSSGTETRERVNYEVSETTREIHRTPGTIKRITVAVLVNGIMQVDDNGVKQWSPRGEDELSALRDLVSNAVGYDEARGDSISIKTMEFEPVAELGTTAETGLLAKLGIDVVSIVKLAVLAIVTIVLGLFVLRPALLSPPQLLDQSDPEQPADLNIQEPVLTGEIEDGIDGNGDLPPVSDFDFGDGGDFPAIAGFEEDPVERLRKLIDERQAETVEILRGWMEDDHEETV